MNGSKLVLDTNIVLYLLSGDKTLANFLQDKQGYVSVITELELIGYPDIAARESQRIKNFLADCTIIEINDEVKSIYVNLRKSIPLEIRRCHSSRNGYFFRLSLYECRQRLQ
jgi:predicted nucleic acid-binding protein